MSTINVNDVYARREPVGDAYDEVRVCGVVGHGGQRPDEYSIESTTTFGPVLQTDAAGILEHCDRISSGDPEDAWETSTS
jgi:hypothetical protein